MISIVRSAVALTAVVSSVLAHSWVDCVKYDPVNQSCLGYPRGYLGRQDANINTEYTYLFSGSPSTQPMCNTKQQSTESYPGNFKMATVQPGETVYTTWEMNGHLNNEAPTTIKILYYPDSSKEFKDVTERDASMVAGSMEFATNGNCYVPGNPNSVCFGSWKVPQDLVPGQTYHFVWFWYFNANPAGQWYSTCFDMKVESESHVVDSSKSMTELLKKGQPSLAYVYGFNDKVVAQVADVSSLSRYAHAANSSSSAAPMASATPMSSAAPMATPTITIDDGGRNPDPAAASTSTPVSSAPAPAMTATPVSSPAPVTSPAPVASPEVATMQDPKHPGKTLKCYRRRRAAN